MNKMQSAVTQTLLSTTFGNFTYELTRRSGGAALKMPRILVVHSSAHQNWARQLSLHLKNDIESAFPGLGEACINELIIEGSREQIQQTLLASKMIAGSKEERADYILTPGFWESQQVHSLRLSAGYQVPQLYCVPGGVEHAAFLFGKKSSLLTSPVNGVSSQPLDYDSYFNALAALLGDVKEIVVLVNVGMTYEGLSSFMHEQQSLVEKAATHLGIKVKPVLWDTSNFDKEHLQRVVKDADAVLTLRDPAVAVHHAALMSLCTENKIPLCASELDSVASGAAIGYGNAGSFYSAPLARMVFQAAFTKKRIDELDAVSFPEQNIIRYNPVTLVDQGVDITPEKKALLEMRSIFDELPVNYGE